MKHRLVSHALILMYHRVTTLQNDPHLLAVSPQNFAAHLEVVRQYAYPISLPELVTCLKDGRVPNRAVVITFDDGYADNLYEAKPVLERYESPATVFVTAGQLESRVEFWWDELDRLFLQPGTLPRKLQLGFNGHTYQWDLGNAVDYSQVEYQRDQGWHLEREDKPTIRHEIFLELFGWLHSLPGRDKQQVLVDLREWAGIEPIARPTHQTMTIDEMTCLANSGLIEIGAHTMVHPPLASLSIEEQCAQIRQSKESLETVLKMPVPSFAFPHGSYSTETISILNQAGFVCACTSHPEPVWRGNSLFQLPRLGVRNWGQETFERWFKWWMDG